MPGPLRKYVGGVKEVNAGWLTSGWAPNLGENGEIGIIKVPVPFDFPQFEIMVSFVLLTGVIKNSVAVIFDPMNNGLGGRSTIPVQYFMGALCSFIMFVLYIFMMFRTLVKNLTPDQGDKFRHAHDEDDTAKPSDERLALFELTQVCGRG